jgi:hypothetical protein
MLVAGAGMAALVVLFYAADYKPETMRVIFA